MTAHPPRPAVSVILPTRDRANTLPRAVESVLGQSYGDIELLIIDDASTDNTEEVALGYSDPRLKYLKVPTPSGAPAARNLGISAASADYIAFQDSDDEWLPDKMQKQMETFENSSEALGVVYTGLLRAGESPANSRPTCEGVGGDFRLALLRGNVVGTPTAVVRRECFKRIGGFDERLPRLQDWELWIRIAQRYEFALVDEPLVRAHVSPDSISTNVLWYIEAKRLILQKHHDLFKASPTVLNDHFLELIQLCARHGQYRREREFIIGAARIGVSRPFLLKRWLLSLTRELVCFKRGFGAREGS